MDRYSKRGVSSTKSDLHHILKKNIKSPYSGSFCTPIPSVFNGNDQELFLMHADGAGTKSSIAYLYWKELGDIEVFRGIAQDAFVMNLDDLLCVGALDDYYISSTIGRNKHRIPKEILKEVIEGTDECIHWLKEMGANVYHSGGETADVGDLVKTLIVDSTFSSKVHSNSFIHAGSIEEGLYIVALQSDGQTNYEKTYNSGIGSNGLTGAKHDLLCSQYRSYRETYDDMIDENYIYNGDYLLTDPLEGTPLTIGKAILSPTRTYYPVLKKMIEDCGDTIYGLIHCSGGGLSKSIKFSSHIHYIKNDLFDFPPIFQLLSKKTPMKEMFTTYNCGQRMEIYIKEAGIQRILDISRYYGLEAKVIGHTEHSNKKTNEMTITYKGESYYYLP